MMSKILNSIFIFCLLLFTLISAVPVKVTNQLPIKSNNSKFDNLTIGEIMNLKSSDLKNSNFSNNSIKEKIVLHFIKKNISKELKKGSLNLNSRLDFNEVFADELYQFNFGGFLLGLFLGLIGVALAHIFSDDLSFRKSSWKGFGVLLILVVLSVIL